MNLSASKSKESSLTKFLKLKPETVAMKQPKSVTTSHFSTLKVLKQWDEIIIHTCEALDDASNRNPCILRIPNEIVNNIHWNDCLDNPWIMLHKVVHANSSDEKKKKPNC